VTRTEARASDQAVGQPDTPSDAFAQYAEWYDAFNREKDYAAEVRYLLDRVNTWHPAVQTWLDVGCGTGGHAALLKATGLVVEGLDVSPSMLAAARVSHPELTVHLARAQDFQLAGNRDVISMLFHAISYQTSDAMLRDAIQNISAHLSSLGVFVFDFWNTAGVLGDPPGRRVREAEIQGRRLVRVTNPKEDRARNLIEVGFEFRWDSASGPLVHRESHLMRHFSGGELADVLETSGLTVVACNAWMTDRPLAAEDWYGLICAQKAV
jgi:SAM-dependent methyltransferase